MKLENILLTSRKSVDIKLADFGLSKCFEHDPLETMCGSPQYVSPEVLALAESRRGTVPVKVAASPLCLPLLPHSAWLICLPLQSVLALCEIGMYWHGRLLHPVRCQLHL